MGRLRRRGDLMKNKIYKLTTLFVLLCLFAFGAFIGCSSNGNGSSNNNTETRFELELNNSNLNTLVGDVTYIRVTNVASDATIAWSSKDENIATVSNGRIVSVREGTTQIVAQYREYTAECTINVSFGAQLPQLVIKNAPATKFTISRTQTNFPFEAAVKFNGKEFTDNLKLDYIVDGDVLAVENGKLKVLKTGETTVMLKANWRGYDVSRFQTFMTKVNIEVVDELYFWVNNEVVNEVKLYTLDEFFGTTYNNTSPFVVSGSFNGQAITAQNFEISYPDFVSFENGNLVAKNSGVGKIVLTYDTGDKELYCSVDVEVQKVEHDFGTEINYFSSNTGTFKDENDGFKNKSVIDFVFGENFDEYGGESLKVLEGKKELNVEDGKILGARVNYGSEYESVLTFETDYAVIRVPMVVYGLVIQCAEDLKNFELTILKNDDPNTPGINETEATCIDGYCALINNIDATGIKIEHKVGDTPFHLYKYTYVQGNGNTTSKGIYGSQYKYQYGGAAQPDCIGKFGFCGDFDGQGYTIFNLDLTAGADENGGAGLFCYTLGAARIYDVAFKNMNISNGCGLARSFYAFKINNASGVDPLGLRYGRMELSDVYLHLSEDTVNPQGAIGWGDVLAGKHTSTTNVVVDATLVKLPTSSKNYGALTAHSTTYVNEYDSNYIASGVYLITAEVPAFHDSDTTNTSTDVTVYGANRTESEDNLNAIVSGICYSTLFSEYKSFEEFSLAKNNYGTFSDSWIISEYPIFPTAKGVVLEYDGVDKYSDKIVLSSLSGRSIDIKSLLGDTISNVSYSYDTSLINVENGTIKLVQDVTSKQTTTLTVNYNINGREDKLLITVDIYPTTYTLSDVPEKISAYDMLDELNNLLPIGQEVLSVKLSYAGVVRDEVKVENGQLVKRLSVKIKSDYSDVETAKVTVKTVDLDVEFEAKVYSHIITEGSDLNPLEHTVGSNENITGYFIMANNINASDVFLNHSKELTSTKFQGVFDGQGYAIYNFKAPTTGLFKYVHSDNDANGGKSIIRNVAFLHAEANDMSNFYSLLAHTLTSSNGGVTEVTNVHVQINNATYVSWPETPNFRGLFAYPDSRVYDSFKMKNVYVEVTNFDATKLAVSQGFGTIITQDVGIVNTTEQQRQNSKRFENVISVAEYANPCVWRNDGGPGAIVQSIDGINTAYFSNSLFFVYGENMIGKDGRFYIDNRGNNTNPSLNQSQFTHGVVADDNSKGSYIYYGLNQYLTASEVESDEMTAFIGSGYWEEKGGLLKWKSRYTEPNVEDENFDIDWL